MSVFEAHLGLEANLTVNEIQVDLNHWKQSLLGHHVRTHLEELCNGRDKGVTHSGEKGD